MLDRRQLHRNRVYYGGMLTFNARNSTIACVVRNFNPLGAKVELESPGLFPDQVDFTVERKGLSWQARLVWRNETTAGLSLAPVIGADNIIPLELARKLHASERMNRKLQARIDQLGSEH